MSFLDRLPFQRRPDGPLNSDGQLYSELWLDQRNARRRIRKRRRQGEITPERAEQLRHFADKGYLVLSLDLDEAIYSEIDQAPAASTARSTFIHRPHRNRDRAGQGAG